VIGEVLAEHGLPAGHGATADTVGINEAADTPDPAGRPGQASPAGSRHS
jgi:hypothetical protein